MPRLWRCTGMKWSPGRCQGEAFALRGKLGYGREMPLLAVTEHGLHCAAGDFFIDPWRGVDRALITHAHADHARPSSRHYLGAAPGVGVLRERLGQAASIEGIPYGERRTINGVRVSFHPAGHVLGAAQVRVEHRGEVWVAGGDYKTQPDPTCATFEPVRCDTFVTESTFGLPVYHWPEPAEVLRELHDWWRGNHSAGRTSVVFAYSLGKAQRILAQLDAVTGPVFVHDAIHRLLPAYAAEGVKFPPCEVIDPDRIRSARGRAFVIAPPAAREAAWLNRIGEVSDAFASGWMAVRGSRRWQSADRGFVLSDHADWRGLNEAIHATGASRVLVTHGYTATLVRWLREQGLDAAELATNFRTETGEE
jgi:putative mRNA 3-end processing factor